MVYSWGASERLQLKATFVFVAHKLVFIAFSATESEPLDLPMEVKVRRLVGVWQELEHGTHLPHPQGITEALVAGSVGLVSFIEL